MHQSGKRPHSQQGEPRDNVQFKLPRNIGHQLWIGVEDEQLAQPWGDCFTVVITMGSTKHLQ